MGHLVPPIFVIDNNFLLRAAIVKDLSYTFYDNLCDASW